MSNDPIAIDIEFECKDVSKALDRLKAHLKSQTLMDSIGRTVANMSRDRIRSKENKAPDGKK